MQMLPRLLVLGHLSSVPMCQAAVWVREQLGKSSWAAGTHLSRVKCHLGLHFVSELRWLAATVSVWSQDAFPTPYKGKPFPM